MTSRLTLVTASDCHLCGHARSVARRLAAELKIEIEELAWESPAADVVRRDGVPFPPALYVGDELLGYGRISEGGVRRRLAGVS
ncbi:MAG TPA: hypothetical protein VGU71_18675 [Candidatus Dormibacteraeota bacterium]|nr:hypothetical protein [Candidatus Dormibacteraeota bacterium]